MTISIAIENPLAAQSRILIDQSEQAIRAVFAPEDCFTFSAEELAQPHIQFFVAREDGAPIGCVALCECGHYGEVKRLFVDDAARGTGAGRLLMQHLHAVAGAQNLAHIKLETGEKLVAAVALYNDMGYRVCAAFGNYSDNPASIFMEKPL